MPDRPLPGAVHGQPGHACTWACPGARPLDDIREAMRPGPEILDGDDAATALGHLEEDLARATGTCLNCPHPAHTGQCAGIIIYIGAPSTGESCRCLTQTVTGRTEPGRSLIDRLDASEPRGLWQQPPGEGWRYFLTETDREVPDRPEDRYAAAAAYAQSRLSAAGRWGPYTYQPNISYGPAVTYTGSLGARWWRRLAALPRRAYMRMRIKIRMRREDGWELLPEPRRRRPDWEDR